MSKNSKRIEGWIFDAYPDEEGMRLWVLEADGGCHTFIDLWRPGFLLYGEKNRLDRGLALLKRQPFLVSATPTERTALFSQKTLPVLDVRVPQRFHRKLVRELEALGLTLYNADIHPVQVYHYERGHFPTAKCTFETEGGRLLDWELRDSPYTIDYELPPFRTAHLCLSGSEIAGRLDPNHAARGSLTLSYEGEVCEFAGPIAEQLEDLSRRITQWDPDIVTTNWGDSYLIPLLEDLERRHGLRLPFSRDPARGTAGKASRTFYSYGRAVRQGGARYFFGRWHLDLRNSFTLKEAQLCGLIEVARLSSVPVQRSARTTIGTSLSSMQIRQAWRDGILVPLRKQQAEDFRSAEDFLVADKGGLTYRPEPGWYDHIVEYDFTSMYPTVMVQNNISPETVNCACCPDNKVPEIGHHLCRRRRGLIPKVLEPLLVKRAEYKRLAKTDHPRAAQFKRRACAQKWILVCCFGYLGFKNARFGKIESHECVNAYGREAILKAKDAVESRGYKMLHALVDSLWIQGRPDMDVEGLRRIIETEAGCPLGLEGVYNWIRFCPSMTDPKAGVPARYFGVFDNGELKFRGIALRRRDTPLLIKNMQTELLALLATAKDGGGRLFLLNRLDGVVEDYRRRLADGGVSAEELAITCNLSRDPERAKGNGMSTIAAQMLLRAGLKLHAGDTLRYVIASAGDAVKEWRVLPLELMEGALEYDVKKYTELLERAARELTDGF